MADRIRLYYMSHLTELFIDSKLAPHDAEVLAADLKAALREETAGFRFVLQSGFLPTIGWFNRLLGVLKPVIGDKNHVEIACSGQQSSALHQAGFHLIADIVEIQPAS